MICTYLLSTDLYVLPSTNVSQLPSRPHERVQNLVAGSQSGSYLQPSTFQKGDGCTGGYVQM